MSELEKSLQSFLQRWSRRKLAAADRATEAPDAAAEGSDIAEPKLQAPVSAEPSAAAFDPASLPPIESIGAATDIRPFLASGVPPELTRAALRRAWTSDPAIRDFIGLAENQWDFTKPDGVPGFGSLELTSELRRMVAELFDQASPNEGPGANPNTNSKASVANSDQPEPLDCPSTVSSGAVAASPVAADQKALGDPQPNDAAVQNEIASQAPDRGSDLRKHGGALPK
jgi:hypothetical protein